MSSMDSKPTKPEAMTKTMKSVIVAIYTGFLPTVSEIGAAKNALLNLSAYFPNGRAMLDCLPATKSNEVDTGGD